jgi:hypothetical protein
MIGGIRSPRPDEAFLRRPRFGRANGEPMNGPLTGRLILIVEDEPLIALSMTLRPGDFRPDPDKMRPL